MRVMVAVVLASSVAMADEAQVTFERRPAFEVNVLWPFFPGGWVDLKTLVPVVRGDQRDFRGELELGLYSDYSWGPISRPIADYGKVFSIGAKVGWRQFIVYGLHVDVSLNLGWRHEEQNVRDGTTLNGFVGRLWAMAGYQYDLTSRVYLNVRGGVGVHLFRTDVYGSTERKIIPSGDVNLGIRF